MVLCRGRHSLARTRPPLSWAGPHGSPASATGEAGAARSLHIPPVWGRLGEMLQGPELTLAALTRPPHGGELGLHYLNWSEVLPLYPVLYFLFNQCFTDFCFHPQYVGDLCTRETTFLLPFSLNTVG